MEHAGLGHGHGEPKAEPACEFCGCTDRRSCSVGAGRFCYWISLDFGRCSVCHELVGLAEELSDDDAATIESIAVALFDQCALECLVDEVGEGMPCDAARLRRIAEHEIRRRAALVPEEWVTGEAAGPASFLPSTIPAEYMHMVRHPDDLERTPRDKVPEALRDRGAAWRRNLARLPYEEFKGAILMLLSDDEPRTWNRIAVELFDKTADVLHGLPPEVALWSLVKAGDVQHTRAATILFRRVVHARPIPGYESMTLCGDFGPKPAEGREVTCAACLGILSSPERLAARAEELRARHGPPLPPVPRCRACGRQLDEGSERDAGICDDCEDPPVEKAPVEVEKAPAIQRCGKDSGLPEHAPCALLPPHKGARHVPRVTLDNVRAGAGEGEGALRRFGFGPLDEVEIRAAWDADDAEAGRPVPSEEAGRALAPDAAEQGPASAKPCPPDPDPRGPTGANVIGPEAGGTIDAGSRVGHANTSCKGPYEQAPDETAEGRGTSEGPRAEGRGPEGAEGVAVGAEGWRGFRAGNLNATGTAGKHPASKRVRAAMSSRRKGTGEPQKQEAAHQAKGSGVSNGDYGTSPSGDGQNEQNKKPWDQRVTADLKTGDASPTEGPDAKPPSTEPAPTEPAPMVHTVRDTVREVAEDAPRVRPFWDRVVVPVLVMVTTRNLWRMFLEHVFASWELAELADFARALTALRAWPDERAAMLNTLHRTARDKGGTDEGVEAGIAHELARASFYEGETATRLRARAIAYAIGALLRGEPEPKRNVLLPESEAQRRLIARLFLTADHVRATSAPRKYDPDCEAALLAWLGERPWDPAWDADAQKAVHDYAIDRLIVLGGLMVAPQGFARPAPLLQGYDPRGGDS